MERVFKGLTIACAAVLLMQPSSSAQRKHEQPSISFGTAKVSLGMTVEQVEGRLAEAARHLQFADKHAARVYRNGVSHGNEGQVTFADGHAVYAAYQMPNADSANELAQEIAAAVDEMDTKECIASNRSSHGTEAGVSQTIFECGSKRFNVVTFQTIGSKERYINVEIAIGDPVVDAK